MLICQQEQDKGDKRKTQTLRSHTSTGQCPHTHCTSGTSPQSRLCFTDSVLNIQYTLTYLSLSINHTLGTTSSLFTDVNNRGTPS